MQFLVLLISVILSVQAIDVHIGFDGLVPTRYGNSFLDLNYNKGEMVPVSFNFTLYMNVDSPFPTTWNYSINGTSIISGTEDFCNTDDSTSPGGIAVQILRYGLGFNDSSCPLKRLTTFRNRPWTWAEAKALDLDDIFDIAATILAGLSIDSNVSSNMKDSPSLNSLDSDEPDSEKVAASSPATGPRGMKRRRRDSSILAVELTTVNEFIDASFKLGADVN